MCVAFIMFKHAINFAYNISINEKHAISDGDIAFEFLGLCVLFYAFLKRIALIKDFRDE